MRIIVRITMLMLALFLTIIAYIKIVEILNK